MPILGRTIGAVISLSLFGAATLLGAQNPTPAGTAKAPVQAEQATPDHAQAYYHFMLARRYKELAGIYNRSDYIDRAISEYKQAIEADPDSLFLRVELAELYWRVSRVGEAIRDAEAVLKENPNYPDAHRLLARIYWHMLGENQAEKGSKESLRKAIEHLEALTRSNPADTDSWLVLGRLYKVNNQGAQAEEAFRKALNAEPGSKTVIANLAQLYFEQGDYDQALDLLKKLPENELDPQLLGMLALAYSQTHDFDNAVATYEKALAQAPENQELRRAYADALLGDAKTDAARAEFQKILKADPEDGFTYLRLGQLDRQEGRFDQARQELEHARTLLPDSLDVPYQQALLEDTLGNQDRAIEIVQGLVKASEKPQGQYTTGEAHNRAVFLERLGLLYRSQNKTDQALEAFNRIVSLGKGEAPRGEELIVDTLRSNHQLPKALEEAEAAIQKYPQERSLRILRAYLLGDQGRVEEAVTQLQTFLNHTPVDRETYLSIAQVYSQAKRYDQAEEALQKALALTANPEEQEYARFLLGSIYERQKKYAPAEEQFQQVLKVNPLNASAANYLGYMLADRGVRLEESVKYIQKALAMEPNNGAYIDSLGWAYFKMSRYDLAEPNLEKAARLIANDPTIHEHLGHLYLQIGKKSRAQEMWERALKEWPATTSSDFDADQAAQLRKQLDELKRQIAKEGSSQK
jgi:tetratricopeptide (TPR) repeat protein